MEEYIIQRQVTSIIEEVVLANDLESVIEYVNSKEFEKSTKKIKYLRTDICREFNVDYDAICVITKPDDDVIEIISNNIITQYQ